MRVANRWLIREVEIRFHTSPAPNDIPTIPLNTLFSLLVVHENIHLHIQASQEITYTRLISSPFSTGNNVKTLVHIQEHTQAIRSFKCSLRMRFEATIGQIDKSTKQADSTSRLKKL